MFIDNAQTNEIIAYVESIRFGHEGTVYFTVRPVDNLEEIVLVLMDNTKLIHQLQLRRYPVPPYIFNCSVYMEILQKIQAGPHAPLTFKYLVANNNVVSAI